jgi:hypothetical protein
MLVNDNTTMKEIMEGVDWTGFDHEMDLNIKMDKLEMDKINNPLVFNYERPKTNKKWNNHRLKYKLRDKRNTDFKFKRYECFVPLEKNKNLVLEEKEFRLFHWNDSVLKLPKITLSIWGEKLDTEGFLLDWRIDHFCVLIQKWRGSKLLEVVKNIEFSKIRHYDVNYGVYLKRENIDRWSTDFPIYYNTNMSFYGKPVNEAFYCCGVKLIRVRTKPLKKIKSKKVKANEKFFDTELEEENYQNDSSFFDFMYEKGMEDSFYLDSVDNPAAVERDDSFHETFASVGTFGGEVKDTLYHIHNIEIEEEFEYHDEDIWVDIGWDHDYLTNYDDLY